MRKQLLAIASCLALSLSLPASVGAQTVTATSQAKVSITKSASAASLKRKLKEELEIRAIKNLLEASFAVRMTPQVEAKLPELVELLSEAIQISMDPPDGEVLSGRATISVSSAKLKEYLVNKGIGAGDIAARAAKILVSIDEFIGVATTNDGNQPVETEVAYSHDKSSFSDTSARASGKQSQAASSANTSKKDVAYSARNAAAISTNQSSAETARVSGSTSLTHANRNAGTHIDDRNSAQYAGAQKSSLTAAAASSTTLVDRTQTARANAASASSSFSDEQKNVQQQNDKVSYSVRTRMPEFNNAKPIGAQDRVLTSRLSGEFQTNGLQLVAENDLRAEGGRLLPIFEITNNGRINQFVELIRKKNIEADVWATGQANYTIVGTTPTGTQCNGNLAVQGRFIETNNIFFEDSLQAAATGNGDQDCRAKLGIALASSLAKVLGERANKALNARNSRGHVYTIYVYSASQLKRSDRRAFQDLLSQVNGLQSSEPNTQERYMTIDVQYAGRLKDTLDQILDQLPWDKAEIVGPKGNKICIGIEGFGACPTDLN